MSLGCTLTDDILQKYPVSVYGRWMSTTQPGNKQTADYVNNTINGWNIGIEQAAQTNTEAQKSKTHEVNPYGDQLRYCGGLEAVFGKPSELVLLEKVEFYVYDGILVGSTARDADNELFQNPDTINAIKASASSITKIYAQAAFHNGMIGQWQPNWFNPKLEINGAPYLGTGGAGVGGPNNIADQSIGVPLPHCETFHLEMNEVISSINIYAKCCQYIGINDDPPTGKLQRYPVLALVYFRLQRR